MPSLAKIVYNWAGADVVGPSVSVFYSALADVNTAITAINVFFNAVRIQLPQSLQISPPVSGDTIDELSGHVIGTWSTGASGPILGGSAVAAANGVGARVVWPTIGIRNGRRVSGSTFLVPLPTDKYEGPGNLTSGFLAVVNPAAVTLGTSANAVRVYSRPRASGGGVSYPTLTGFCPDKVSWLRSRRT